MGKVDGRPAVARFLAVAYLAGSLVAAAASGSTSAIKGGVGTEPAATPETRIASEPRGPRCPGRSASAELLQAAAHNDFECMREIASAGKGDVNASAEDGWTALIFAVRADDAAAVRLLLQQGADPNVHERDSGIIGVPGSTNSLLLEGRSALHYARSAEVVRMLLDSGANPSAVNASGYPPIHWSSPEATRVLLERGVDPNSRQSNTRHGGLTFPGDGITALMNATARCDNDVLALLIDAGAAVNARDRWQNTALHYAARCSPPVVNQQKAEQVIQTLLKAGADPNVRNSAGRTPLMEVAKSQFVEGVSSLLIAGANPAYCDVNGHNAADELEDAFGASGSRSSCSEGECYAVVQRLRGDRASNCASLPPPPSPLPVQLTSGVVLGHILFTADIMVATILACSTLCCPLILARASSRKRAAISIAYLGYAVCALVVGLFQLHLFTEGADIFMAFGLFLVPILISGGLAIVMTVATWTNVTLRILGFATIGLGLLQVAAPMVGVESFMNGIARVYVVTVLAACAYRRREWWLARDRGDV
jgi:ankyrin repeat protein